MRLTADEASDAASPIFGLAPLMRDRIDMRTGLGLAVNDGIRKPAKWIDAEACFRRRSEALILFEELHDSIELDEESVRDATACLLSIVESGGGKLSFGGGMEREAHRSRARIRSTAS